MWISFCWEVKSPGFLGEVFDFGTPMPDVGDPTTYRVCWTFVNETAEIDPADDIKHRRIPVADDPRRVRRVQPAERALRAALAGGGPGVGRRRDPAGRPSARQRLLEARVRFRAREPMGFERFSDWIPKVQKCVLYFLLVYIFIISFSIRFFSPKDA